MDRDRERKRWAEFVLLGHQPNAGKRNLAIFVSSTRWGDWNKFSFKGGLTKECLFPVCRAPFSETGKMEPVSNLGLGQATVREDRRAEGTCPLHGEVKGTLPSFEPLPSSPYHPCPRELQRSLAPG